MAHSVQIDYQRLLWQQLNGMLANDDLSMFVQSDGQLLDPVDFQPLNQKSDYNTSLLVDDTVKCAINKADAGAHYSVLWKQLITSGQGPPSDELDEVKFENARSLLYKNYPTQISDYYKKWNDVYRQYRIELVQLEDNMKQKYGDSWKEHYEEQKNLVSSYNKYNMMKPHVEPAIESILQYRYGKYYSQIQSLSEC